MTHAANDFKLNSRALRLVDDIAARAAELRVAVETVPGAGRVIDAGINAPGGLEAGLALARVAMAGLGEVALVPSEAGGLDLPLVQVHTDHPVASCMAAQYAGWAIQVGKYFAMGSGPMRAAYGGEDLFKDIGHREEAACAVGILETRKMPTAEVFQLIAAKTRLEPEKVSLLVAPTASQAGTLQVVARSVETALHKLHALKFPLDRVVSGFGTAPLGPVARDDLAAIGRTNDCVLYGARVTLWVRGDDETIAAVGPKVPSSASKDHGAPFAEIFERYGRDFYKIDPGLFSPAEVSFQNLDTGRTHRFGRREDEVLKRSLLS